MFLRILRAGAFHNAPVFFSARQAATRKPSSLRTAPLRPRSPTIRTASGPIKLQILLIEVGVERTESS